jgi:hypothetical protein
MASGQQRQGNHERSRPGRERPPPTPGTTETPERSDQQAIPALEHDRRERNGDRRQRIPDEPGRARDLGGSSGYHRTLMVTRKRRAHQSRPRRLRKARRRRGCNAGGSRRTRGSRRLDIRTFDLLLMKSAPTARCGRQPLRLRSRGRICRGAGTFLAPRSDSLRRCLRRRKEESSVHLRLRPSGARDRATFPSADG